MSDNMDEELIGRFNGYAQWAAEVYWNKRTDEVQKQQGIAQLRENRRAGFEKNKITIAEVNGVIQKKQIPTAEMHVRVAADMRETLKQLKEHFKNMHAEIHVADIAQGAARVHENVAIVYDALKRQEKILLNLNEETFHDLIPHLFFLYDKELQLNQSIERHSYEMYKKSTKVVKHIHKNYFSCLKAVSGEKQFFEDHKEILLATYVFSVSGRIVGNVHGLNTTEGRQAEAAFIGRLAELTTVEN